MSDDALVSAAKAGDPEAWRELYRAHAGRLEAWLASRPTGDATVSAEDVAAEAWLVAASKVADFDGTAEQFAGWLFGIARKVGAGTRRRSERRRTHPGDTEPHLPEVADHAPELAGRDWARRAIASLPPRERDAVGLVDGLGFDNRTAASVLGVSPVALRVARHRGLRRLRTTAPPAVASDGRHEDAAAPPTA